LAFPFPLDFFPISSYRLMGGAISETSPVGIKSGCSSEVMVVADRATNKVVGSTLSSCDRGTVGPCKKLPIRAVYSSNRGADLGYPNRLIQMLAERTFCMSSRLTADSRTSSREGTAKKKKKKGKNV
jgi:hypothetical protein